MRSTRLALAVVLPLLAGTSDVAAAPSRAAVLWQDSVAPLGPDAQANGVVAGGGQVFVSGFLDGPEAAIGLVRSYDARTGALRWQDMITDGRSSYEAGRVALAEGRLFAVVFAARGNAATGVDWVVRAYDALSGEPLWQDDHDQGRSDQARAVAVADGRVLVAGAVTGPGGLAAFAARAYTPDSGALLWQHQEPEDGDDVARSVVGAGGRVFVGGSSMGRWLVQALDAASGLRLWSDVSTEEEAFAAVATVADLAVLGSHVLAAGTIAGHSVIRAYDAATGAVIWERRELGAESETLALVASGTRLHAGIRLGSRMLLQALDPRTGEVVWQRRDAGVGSSLSLFGAQLVAAGGAAVHAYDARNGALRWVQAIAEAGSCLALAHDGPIVFAAGTTRDDLFHVRAFAEGGALRSIQPGRGLPRLSRN